MRKMVENVFAIDLNGLERKIDDRENT